MVQDYEEGNMTSEFNEAKFQIWRLHAIWASARTAREAGELKAWRWILDSAEIELSHDAERIDERYKEDTEGAEKKEEGHQSWSRRLEKINETIMETCSKLDKDNIYNSLKEKEKFLRSLQEASGKGGRLKPEDDEFEF